GGAIATSYQRCRGQMVSASSPVAAPSTSASVGPSPASNDCAGFRAATRSPLARSTSARRAPTQVLPTSVPVPVMKTSRSGRSTNGLPQCFGEKRDLVIGVGGGKGDAQAGGPGGHRRGPDGRYQQAAFEEGGAGRQRP